MFHIFCSHDTLSGDACIMVHSLEAVFFLQNLSNATRQRDAGAKSIELQLLGHCNEALSGYGEEMWGLTTLNMPKI